MITATASVRRAVVQMRHGAHRLRSHTGAVSTTANSGHAYQQDADI
jgi:hypothetical protein